MGANIKGAGTSIIRVERYWNYMDVRIQYSDRIELETYLSVAAVGEGIRVKKNVFSNT